MRAQAIFSAAVLLAGSFVHLFVIGLFVVAPCDENCNQSALIQQSADLAPVQTVAGVLVVVTAAFLFAVALGRARLAAVTFAVQLGVAVLLLGLWLGKGGGVGASYVSVSIAFELAGAYALAASLAERHRGRPPDCRDDLLAAEGRLGRPGGEVR